MVNHSIFTKRLQTGFVRATKIFEKVDNNWTSVIQLLKEVGLQTMDLALCGWPVRLAVQGKAEVENKTTPSSVLAGLMLRVLYDAQEKGVESELVEDGKLVEPKPELSEATAAEYTTWLEQMFPHVAREYYQFIIDQYR